jgi:hypothetical protein
MFPLQQGGSGTPVQALRRHILQTTVQGVRLILRKSPYRFAGSIPGSDGGSRAGGRPVHADSAHSCGSGGNLAHDNSPVLTAGKQRIIPSDPSLPLEMMWSKIKAQLRKTKASTKQLLDDAIAEAFDLVSPTGISGWFVKDDYRI